MRTLYFDCAMGAAGDMLTAALLELMPEKEEWIAKWNALSIPGVEFRRETVTKQGIQGTHIRVLIHGEEESDGSEPIHEHPHHEHSHEHGHPHEHAHEHHHHEEHAHHHHHHTGMAEIEALVNGLSVSDRVKQDVLAVYQLIAEAESSVHGRPVSQIHFHEVGMMDAVADVTAVCMLMEALDPAQVVVSPVHVGSGHVHCAHGIMPVPAPATAYLLRGVPCYGGSIRGELCTPTGAALLKHFATRFDSMPQMRTESIGYGMGTKEFEQVNCIRVFLGETEDQTDCVYELRCNLDDTTAEEIGFAMERLLEAGALDVWTTPIGMKKSRPGTMLSVLCRDTQREALVKALFRHTSTIGIRESECPRYTLRREMISRETPFGTVRYKHTEGYGVLREKAEYEDLSRIARERDLSLTELMQALKTE